MSLRVIESPASSTGGLTQAQGDNLYSKRLSAATRNGTADVTLTTTDKRVQRFTGLTGNRLINLPTGVEGDSFLIRLSAYANFTLDVGGIFKFPPNVNGSASVGHDGTSWQVLWQALGLYDLQGAWHKPATALSETLQRHYMPTSQALLLSGRLSLFSIVLRKDMVINTISFFSSATALVGGTNQWFSLHDASFARLGTTSDDTTTAWAANSKKALNLTSPVTTPSDGIYYLGIMVAATTVPTLQGISGIAAMQTEAPATTLAANTGLTTPPAPNPPSGISTLNNRAYAYVS